MQLTLRFQTTGAVPGNAGPVTLRGQNLTIGRAPENDLVLPDPDRTISKRHCVLEERNDGFVVIDISANGTFLNYGKEPLGPEHHPVENGDILSIGPYELIVETGEVQSQQSDFGAGGGIPAGQGPFASAPPVQNEPETGLLDELLGPSTGTGVPSGGELIPEHADDDLMSGLPSLPEVRAPDPVVTRSSEEDFEGQHFQPSPPAGSGGGNMIPDDWEIEPTVPDTPEVPEPIPPVDSVVDAPAKAAPAAPEPEVPAPKAPDAPRYEASADLAQAYFQALGITPGDLEGEALEETMARMGGTMRTLIIGIREILMTRTAIKGEFRMGQTVIQRTGNNPLKFSITEDEAVERIAKPPGTGYMDPEKAASEALADIRAHEVAMVAGMQAALKGLLAEFDPEKLAHKMAESTRSSSFLKSKKSQYWEVFEETYAAISAQAENDFNELFTREFARAYQAQSEKLK